MKQRVVITGMGAVTPIGIGLEEYWENLKNGKCGVGMITRFDTSGLPCRIGAEVKDFIPENFMPKKLVRETETFMRFGLASVKMALEHSGLNMEKEDSFRVGIILGTAFGGIPAITEAQDKISRTGSVRMSPHFIPRMLGNIAATHAAITYGFKGPALTVSTACASGGDAAGLASMLLGQGEADVIIAVGAESLFCAVVMGGLYAARAVSVHNDEPEKACRPFDFKRDGLVLGEGAGAVVMETLDHALQRGAFIQAEVLGYANLGEGYHTTAPAPDGFGEIRCMRMALEKAQVAPEEIDYINAHGTSTPLGDRVETMSIKSVFGSHAGMIPVSSCKGATGHLVGAGGITELIACVKAIREGIVPPTINYEEPDPECDLDYVPNRAKKAPVRTAMSNSFGFGGQNACLIVRQFSS
ncbi:MAG TPA: beta-ketoacyl-[acyl-carrier-protein] synthase II [Desulfotomaculum sp.]|nr:MAG: 3-oxoacyl-[acyl-carrier-protein] synthase 2 [Desulfotomaculum sp. 46_80]HAG10350.1 beta-ketoacyl-[acyl-carrier-protein] synthase II [Desulfotomaculum sp.]HBY04139.1 beta-ketoacyl-[acyl-carrier-protein] synthase II [Desulfotomaculum sp.]